MSTTIDAEVMPEQSQALQVRQVQPVGLFGTNDPASVVEKATGVANALKGVIVKQGLVSKISGKEYPRCEAWTLLGTMLGVFPVTVWTKQVEGGWEARVEARTRDGAIIGAAEAQCLRGEKNWANRDDFALRSMAQTRATAKCLRMPLGFVMTLAGFEATPAEEMASDHPIKPEPKPSTPPLAVKPTTATIHVATVDQREKMIAGLADFQKPALEYFQKIGCLMPNEGLADLPLRFVPATAKQWEALKGAIIAFTEGHEAKAAFPPNEEAAVPKPVEVPRQADLATPEAAEAWRAFPMPWGKQSGVPLGELEKKYLYGLWANFKVEEEYNGKPKRLETVAKDRLFRTMLDDAGAHYKFETKD